MQYEEIKELIAIFEKTDLNDMEVELDNAKVRLNRGPVAPWMIQAPQMVQPQGMVMPMANAEDNTSVQVEAPKVSEIKEDSAKESDAGTKVIKAPIVGTFYQSSAPGEDPFVKIGDNVSEGEVVCIIEAMKFMNEVNSTVSGTITEVLVKDGDFVEYGQELFRVK